jgi:hypothetical protein
VLIIVAGYLYSKTNNVITIARLSIIQNQYCFFGTIEIARKRESMKRKGVGPLMPELNL